MSGVEILGLVLAVIPLAMSARAQMSKSTARSRAFFKQRKQAKNLIEALDDSLGKLHLYVWAVLGKTELSEIEKDRLMRKENLGGDAWAQIHVEAEINRVLGPASTSFMSILRCLVDQLLQLSTHNAIPRFDDVDGTATLRSWIGAARHEEKTFLDGLRFAWDAPSHGKTLGVIQDCNTRLDELLRAWEMAERYQPKQDKRQVHLAYQMRQETARLGEALKKSCTCTPRARHEAKILMRRRDDLSAIASHTDFDLLMGDATCEISVSVNKDCLHQSSLPPPTTFVLEDICQSIGMGQGPPSRVKWTIDEQLNLRAMHAIPLGSLHGAPTFRGLHECLNDLQVSMRTSSDTCKRRLLKEKRILGIILAHSLLHLLESPWHCQGWDPQNVHFLNRASTTALPDPTSQLFGQTLRKPYITTRLSADSVEDVQQRAAITTPDVQEWTLFALGAMLLELHSGQSLLSRLRESHQPRHDATLALDQCYEDSKDSIESMSDEYKKAVRFCLWPGQRHNSFDNAAFREMYYAEVMANLDTDLEQGWETHRRFWRSL